MTAILSLSDKTGSFWKISGIAH